MANILNSADTNSTLPKQTSGKPKSFNCPNCGGSIVIKALGHSISAVCGYCSSVIDVANENFRILVTAHEKTRNTLLSIGGKGHLAGTLWEVIGYMEKADGTGAYRWDEYLLYNPYQGFRFLVQANGHWTLFKVLKRAIAGAGAVKDLRLSHQKYSPFLKGWAVVTYVKGEFYWRVQKGERVKITEYIAPPYLLTVDQNEQEINLALGEYIDSEVIASAFNISTAMPYKMGIAANQPDPYAKSVGNIWFTAGLAFMFATVMQIAAVFAADNAVVFENSWTLAAVDKNKTISTQGFTLPKQSNLQIASAASVNNDWLELELSLINEQNNAEFNTAQALEYYFGSDSDGAWSQGSQSTASFFPALPAGRYRLLIDVDAGAFQKGSAVHFSIKATRDVPVWSNYWLTLLFIIVYPCFVSYRRISFEGQRWSESDFAEAYQDPLKAKLAFLSEGFSKIYD